jgi:hypothetical protein
MRTTVQCISFPAVGISEVPSPYQRLRSNKVSINAEVTKRVMRQHPAKDGVIMFNIQYTTWDYVQRIKGTTQMLANADSFCRCIPCTHDTSNNALNRYSTAYASFETRSHTSYAGLQCLPRGLCQHPNYHSPLSTLGIYIFYSVPTPPGRSYITSPIDSKPTSSGAREKTSSGSNLNLQQPKANHCAQTT